jgi:hypothetical protein
MNLARAAAWAMSVVAVWAVGPVACSTDGGIDGTDPLPPADLRGDDLTDAAEDVADVIPDTMSDIAIQDVEGDSIPDTLSEISDDAAQDAIDDAVGPDAEPPPEAPSVWLTVAEIPPEMNGSIDSIEDPLSWRLRVNRAHVTLDVFARADGGPVAWNSLELDCDDGSGPRAMEPVEEVDAGHARVFVTADTAFADGSAVVCTATVSGPGGEATDSFAFDAATLPESLDPFTTVDPWLVTISRDLFEVVVTPNDDDTADVESEYVAGGNGVPDLDEALHVIGLTSPDYPEAAAAIRAHLLRRTEANVRRFLDLDGDPRFATRIDLRFEGTDVAAEWSALDSAALDAARISRIALGGDGDPADQRAGTFGRALIDWNNQDFEDDTVYGLGVFPTALVRAAMAQPIAAFLLASIRPDLGGTPFGGHPGDAHVIGIDGIPPNLPPIEGIDDRAFYYDLLINFMALGLASVLTHEMGHSLGLVPYGPPPEGLFAGVAVDFVEAVAPDAHIDTAGMNIMQTGGSADVGAILGGEIPAFEPLSMAYLRRMLVVGPPAR